MILLLHLDTVNNASDHPNVRWVLELFNKFCEISCSQNKELEMTILGFGFNSESIT